MFMVSKIGSAVHKITRFRFYYKQFMPDKRKKATFLKKAAFFLPMTKKKRACFLKQALL